MSTTGSLVGTAKPLVRPDTLPSVIYSSPDLVCREARRSDFGADAVLCEESIDKDAPLVERVTLDWIRDDRFVPVHGARYRVTVERVDG